MVFHYRPYPISQLRGRNREAYDDAPGGQVGAQRNTLGVSQCLSVPLSASSSSYPKKTRSKAFAVVLGVPGLLLTLEVSNASTKT